MVEKIKELFLSAVKKLPDIHISVANMWIIYAYGCFFALFVLAFIVGWAYMAYMQADIDLQALRDMFDSLTDPQVVAAVTFIAVFSVDKDKNGISDAVEDKLANKDGEQRRYEV